MPCRSRADTIGLCSSGAEWASAARTRKPKPFAVRFSNAPQPFEAGPRELLIGTERTQAKGAVVAVRDSGPGIDPENFERVFEAFYTTKTSGMGMGLSICRSIIDAHGGRLWAGVNEPRGAGFQFTLPDAETEIMGQHPANLQAGDRYEGSATDPRQPLAYEDNKRARRSG